MGLKNSLRHGDGPQQWGGGGGERERERERERKQNELFVISGLIDPSVDEKVINNIFGDLILSTGSVSQTRLWPSNFL